MPAWLYVARARRAAACAPAAPAGLRAQQPALIAIRAGRLVDVEHGEVRRDQVVLVRGERSTRCSPRRRSSLPARG